MKVLIFNQYSLIGGGVNSVAGTHIKVLRTAGVDVKEFAYHNSNFVKRSSLEKISDLTAVLRKQFCLNKFQEVINSFKPGIIHFHNIHSFFSAPLWDLIDPGGGKIIQHLHGYYPFCLDGTLFRNGEICLNCLDENSFLSGVKYSCYDNSKLKSVFGYLTRPSPGEFVKKSQSCHKFISVSDFTKSVFVNRGIEESKIVTIPNPCSFQSTNTSIKSGKYFLFIGALDKIKGLKIIPELALKMPGEKFVIAGEGKLKEFLKNASLKIHNLEVKDYVSGNNKAGLIANCKAFLLTSIWWEPAPVSILEAFSFGKPVIASNTGGLPELISEGATGHLFQSGSVDSIISKIKLLNDNLASNSAYYNNNCLAKASRHTEEAFLQNLLIVYKELMGNNGK
ncbi:MAG: glycosyltransferase [Ignavibacteriaceae bacterium]|nr:glycosyltransferase [Ignavibacteriaceae bacterium]